MNRDWWRCSATDRPLRTGSNSNGHELGRNFAIEPWQVEEMPRTRHPIGDFPVSSRFLELFSRFLAKNSRLRLLREFAHKKLKSMSFFDQEAPFGGENR